MKPTKAWAITGQDCELRWDRRHVKGPVYSALFKVKADALVYERVGQHVVRVEIREIKGAG